MNRNIVNRYICELLIAVCAIVAAVAQLKVTLINWSGEEEDK